MADGSRRPTLASLEGWLVAVAADGDGATAGVRRAGAAFEVGARDLSELGAVITPGPALSALERVAIYNDGYFARLVECLADDYPAIQAALGEAEFDRLARAYIAAYPSRSPSLNAYGASMERYLRTRRDAWAPFAADLARLEWALVEVIHAETRPSLDPGALAQIRPEDFPRARLVPSPALRVLELAYPVNRYYQAFRDGAEPALPAPERAAVAVHRQGLVVYRLTLTAAMHTLLAGLVRGETLAAALTGLESALPPAELATVQAQLSGWFGEWTGAGFFAGIELV